MKKIVFGLMLVVLLLGACASPVEAPIVEKEALVVELATPVEKEPEVSVFQEAQDGKPFRFPNGQYGGTWMSLLLAGWLQACDDYGLLCEHTYISDNDEAGVLSYVDTITTENTSGVMIGMWVESRFITGKKLVEDGISFVAPHVGIDASIVPGMVAWAGPDPDEYSLAAGKAMAEKVDCEGPVGFSQSQSSPMENVVTAGLQQGFRELCPDTEFLETVLTGNLDMAKAIAVSSAVIQANPDLRAAMTSTAPGGEAWARAAQENGKEAGEIVIQGMDYMEVNLDLVSSGDIWMLIGQPVYEEAYYSVVLLVNNLMGLPVPYANILPAPQITLENVAGFYDIIEKAEEAMTK